MISERTSLRLMLIVMPIVAIVSINNLMTDRRSPDVLQTSTIVLVGAVFLAAAALFMLARRKSP